MLLHGWQMAPSTRLHWTASHMFEPHESHGWQVTVPVPLAKEPSGHAVHVAALEWLVAVPIAHGVCSVLPVDE